MCGEQNLNIMFNGKVAGSPPRVRGTESGVISAASQERITPACAGNSLVQSMLNLLPLDHPRVCGEQPFAG